MRAYGLKRFLIHDYLDKEDCLSRGSKSQTMKLKSKVRKFARRYWKKSHRLKVVKEIKNSL